MRCRFEKNWKNWAVVGFLLTSVAYVATCASGKPQDLEELNGYAKAGIGLLSALVGAGLSAGAERLKARFCTATRELTETDKLKEVLVSGVRNQALINKFTQPLSSSSLVATFTPLADKDTKHAHECNELVKKYLAALGTGNVNTKLFLETAQTYQDEYPGFTPLKYLTRLRAHGYQYEEIPTAYMTRAPSAQTYTFQRITPPTSASASPRSTNAESAVKFTPPTPKLLGGSAGSL